MKGVTLILPTFICREGGQCEGIVRVKAWNRRHQARAQEQITVSLGESKSRSQHME